jgi:hypothetical protein
MISPLTLTLPFALTAYLFVAAPKLALCPPVIAGTVTALVGPFKFGQRYVRSRDFDFVSITFVLIISCFSLDIYSFFLPFQR